MACDLDPSTTTEGLALLVGNVLFVGKAVFSPFDQLWQVDGRTEVLQRCQNGGRMFCHRADSKRHCDDLEILAESIAHTVSTAAFSPYVNAAATMKMTLGPGIMLIPTQ